MAASPIIDKHSKAKTPRRFARQRIETLVYIDLGSGNGGFPIDINEGGVAFQGILPLEKDQTICVTLKLPGIDGSFTATAKIVWLNTSQKGGALKFIDLPKDSRLLLKNWLSAQRQAGNPKENRTVVASGVVTKGLPPVPAISLQADHNMSSVKANPAVAAPSPIPASSRNEAAQAAKPKDAPKFEPHVPSKGAKKRFRITALALGLTISTIFAGINLWPLRIILFPNDVNNHPAQPAVPIAPVPEAPLPLANPSAVELSSDPPPVATTVDAEGQEFRTVPAPPNAASSAPSRPVAKARTRAPQTKSGKVSNVHVPPAQDTRSPGAAIAPASSGQPITVPPNSISQSVNDLPAPASSGERNSSPAVIPPQEAVTAAGSIEIKSDPHPSVHMTPELEWRASWPGINPAIGRLVSSVPPLYPKDALRQRIAGAVHLHVVVGRSGAVEKVEPKDGPALLADAALRAVQQWRFEPTLLAGQAIEAEQNVTIVFRLANPSTAGN